MNAGPTAAADLAERPDAQLPDEDAARITMDRAGRLVIPKPIRTAANLIPGVPLLVRCRDGRVEIERESKPYRLIRERRFLVAESTGAEPLTAQAVNRTRDDVRSRS